MKSLARVIEEDRSNLTVLHNHIVVLTAIQESLSYTASDGGYIHLQAYKPTTDTWNLLESYKCYFCWTIPSIIGLPTGQLLVLGIAQAPGQTQRQRPQFDILQVTAKGTLS